MKSFRRRQIKSNWTEDEYQRLRGIADTRGVLLGSLVRDIVSQFLEHGLTRGERLTLIAVRELQQTYFDVLETTVTNKALTVNDLEEIERTNRFRRDALAQQFLNQMESVEEDNDER